MAYTKTDWLNDSAPAISAANLNKLEDGVGSAHEQLDAATNSATASTIMKRTANGAVSVGTPTADAHATTKGYVDSAVAAVDTGASESYVDNAIAALESRIEALEGAATG